MARHLADDDHQRLVLDIGGAAVPRRSLAAGSTRCRWRAWHIGCVGFSQRHFPKGEITSKAVRRAETAARLEFQPVAAQFRALGWQTAYGASGTVRAIGAMLQARRWGKGDITLDALYRLREVLLGVGHVRHLKSLGVGEDRAAVLPGGLAILIAAFEALEIKRLEVSDGALREGCSMTCSAACVIRMFVRAPLPVCRRATM